MLRQALNQRLYADHTNLNLRTGSTTGKILPEYGKTQLKSHSRKVKDYMLYLLDSFSL